MLGTTKSHVDEKDKIYIVEMGNTVMWKNTGTAFTCAISSPKKESKFHGMKSFIAYTITPSVSFFHVYHVNKFFEILFFIYYSLLYVRKIIILILIFSVFWSTSFKKVQTF